MRTYDENPYPNLVDRPILYVKGTEDDANGGFDAGVELYNELNKLLHNVEFYAAAGGSHSTGWNRGLPKVFEFLNAQY